MVAAADSVNGRLGNSCTELSDGPDEISDCVDWDFPLAPEVQDVIRDVELQDNEDDGRQVAVATLETTLGTDEVTAAATEDRVAYAFLNSLF